MGLGFILVAGIGRSIYLIDAPFHQPLVHRPNISLPPVRLPTTTTTMSTVPRPPFKVQDETVTLFDPSRATPPLATFRDTPAES